MNMRLYFLKENSSNRYVGGQVLASEYIVSWFGSKDVEKEFCRFVEANGQGNEYVCDFSLPINISKVSECLIANTSILMFKDLTKFNKNKLFEKATKYSKLKVEIINWFSPDYGSIQSGEPCVLATDASVKKGKGKWVWVNKNGMKDVRSFKGGSHEGELKAILCASFYNINPIQIIFTDSLPAIKELHTGKHDIWFSGKSVCVRYEPGHTASNQMHVVADWLSKTTKIL